MNELLARIESFQPENDSWLLLDAHVQALFAHGGDLAPALPALLRVFERFPRHDGHGVLWAVLHAIEGIPGYEPLLVEHVRRTPTEMGLTMLQRLITGGISHVGTTDLAPLIVELTPRAPVIDYTIDSQGRDPLLARLDALQPADDLDWGAARLLVDEVVRRRDLAPAVTPLLRVLDRFHDVEAFPLFWPIVNGLEARAEFPSALVASLRSAPTRNGLTLLLRQLGLRNVTTIDGVDVAALATELSAGDT